MYENFVRHCVLWESLLNFSFLYVCGEVCMFVYRHREARGPYKVSSSNYFIFFGNRFSLNLILPIQIDWLAGKPKIVKIWHHKCVLSASSFFMNAGILTYVLILEAQTLLRENILSPIVTLNDINFLYSISILSFYFLDGMIPEVTLAAFYPDGVYHKMSVEAWMCREGF